MTNRIHFHDDVPHSKANKEEFEKLAGELQEEFPEISRLEVSLNHQRDDFETHIHITGKDLELASKGNSELGIKESLADAFDRARRQLRKHHDKVIFQRRRDSQKTNRG